MPMAASEGQLALELVQALTAEARAHREYLQSLYTLIAGFAGAAVVIAAALISIFNRIEMKNLRKELQAAYQQEAVQASEEGVKIIKVEVENLRLKLAEHEASAREHINNIALFAADLNKSKHVGTVKQDKASTRLRIDYFPNYIDVGKEVVRILAGMGFVVSGNMNIEEAKGAERLGDIAIIDLDECTISDAAKLYNICAELYGFRKTLVYATDNDMAEMASKYFSVTVGPAELISKLHKINYKNFIIGDR